MKILGIVVILILITLPAFLNIGHISGNVINEEQPPGEGTGFKSHADRTSILSGTSRMIQKVKPDYLWDLLLTNEQFQVVLFILLSLSMTIFSIYPRKLS